MPDDPELLECDSDPVEKTGPAKGSDANDDAPVARARAAKVTYKNAVDDVLALVSRYACPEACPQLLLRVEISEVKVKRGGVSPLGTEYGGSCTWTVTISCSGRSLAGQTAKRVEDQQLLCDERASGRGSATGEGAGATKEEAEKKALEDLQTGLRLALGGSLLAPDDASRFYPRVECPEDCPNQKIRIRLDPPSTKCTAPTKDVDNWKCSAARAWSIRIECTS